MRNLILLLLCFTCTYCTNTNNEKKTSNADTLQTAENDTTSTPDEYSVDGCYMLILKRDTMVLHFQNNENVLYGRLTFDNFEKDGSTGNVQGELSGDIIKLTYTFTSEGMNSVMDVYFKVVGDKLLRGIGEMGNKGDTAYFKNPSQLTYPADQPFFRTPCEQVPAKYRL